jgi:hypothetical protein
VVLVAAVPGVGWGRPWSMSWTVTARNRIPSTAGGVADVGRRDGRRALPYHVQHIEARQPRLPRAHLACAFQIPSSITSQTPYKSFGLSGRELPKRSLP